MWNRGKHEALHLDGKSTIPPTDDISKSQCLQRFVTICVVSLLFSQEIKTDVFLAFSKIFHCISNCSCNYLQTLQSLRIMHGHPSSPASHQPLIKARFNRKTLQILNAHVFWLHRIIHSPWMQFNYRGNVETLPLEYHLYAENNFMIHVLKPSKAAPPNQ